MAVYPEIYYELYINDAWEDLTPDVVLSQDASYGISGNSQVDRVASTGVMNLLLRNDAGCLGGIDGYYSPYKSLSKSGWRIGLPLRLKIIYDGATIIKFYGYIDDIQPESGDEGTRRVQVTVVDWMEYAAKHPIFLPTLQENKKIDDVAVNDN